jgi:two-component system, NarL family, response regulator NreC
MHKILVIEDSESLLEEIFDTLRFENFDVIGAENGLIGLRMAREYMPDLIVCDIMMPEMDGYEVLQELRSDLATAMIPFIFLTAKAERSDMRKGMELGADDYLTKPFANAELLATIRARLAKQIAIETQRLRAFSHRLVTVQENERRQIANKLQNEIGQITNGLKLTLEMSKHLPPDALRSTFINAQGMVDSISEKIDNTALDLWPTALEHLDLLPALFWQFERYTNQTQIEVNFQHTGLEGPFEPELKTTVYRILQKGLSNVANHADVEKVTAQIWIEEEVLNIQIVDEGNGFNLEEVLADGASIGLVGMRERALSLNGDLTIVTALGKGTSVFVRIPLGDSVEKAQPHIPDVIRSLTIAPPNEKSPVQPTKLMTTPKEHDEKTIRPRSKRVGENINIVLADGNDIMRQGLRSLLVAEPGFSVLGQTASGLDVLDLVEHFKPDVLVLDLTMPEIGGLDILREVAQHFPNTRVIILSTYHEEAYFLEAFRGGASGYILKNSSADDLALAIHEVVAGRRFLDQSLSERAIESYIDIQKLQKDTTLDAYGTLTNREREILHFVLDGHTNAQIARHLVISPRTAETHRANMMRKLGVHNQTELIRYALRRGIISMDD